MLVRVRIESQGEEHMFGKDVGDNEQTRKDTTYSPASETETEAKQDETAAPAIEPDAADKINVAPGTGGPDDVGDIEVNDEDINLPPFGKSVEPPD
jgi:hypothetical protein